MDTQSQADQHTKKSDTENLPPNSKLNTLDNGVWKYPKPKHIDWPVEVELQIDNSLLQVKEACIREIEADSFFNGNISADQVVTFIQFSGTTVGSCEMPVEKCDLTTAMQVMKIWAQQDQLKDWNFRP
jgi:hypothetical protein